MSGQPPIEDRPARPAELLGRTIAVKFVIETVIGTGAMGVVYRAKQTALDKVVAIKVMHGGLASDETFAARFHREAKAASRLDHPNSIRILDFGQEPDGRLYIAMDYLDGRDLLEVINHEWPLSTNRMVDLLAQALSALAVAHELGILHRDLKPENIMVLRDTDDDGTPADLVKVCDFGIAKLIERDDDPEKKGERLSTGGIVVGTPAYMSPEQARGEPLDLRSDVYAMGVILYQMLTMRVPFDAPTPLSTLLKLVNEEPARPSSLSSYVEPKLEEVCLKAISKKPEDRYQNAREMRAALRFVADARGAAEATPTPAAAVRRDIQTAATSTLPALAPAPQAVAKAPRHAWPSWVWLGAGAAGVVGITIVTMRVHGSVARLPAGAAVEVAPAEAPPVAEPPRVEVDPPTIEVPEVASAPNLAGASGPSLAITEPVPAGRRATVTPRVAEPPHARGAETSIAVLAPATAASAPPIVSNEPPSAPPPTKPPPAPTVAIDVPRSDPTAARVEVGTASNTVGTTAASVNKAIGPAAGRFVACYRASITSGLASDGPATLHLETNDEGVVTEARLDARIAAPLAGCIAGAVRGRKIANVDTGSASADVPLVFRSR
jgi:serine/threonine-protein kinase